MKKGSMMAKGDDIEERLIRFAVSVLDLREGLPKTVPGTHIGNHHIRSATSAAPNYAEARGCESMNDFMHKLGIVLKELIEACVWLRMARIR